MGYAMKNFKINKNRPPLSDADLNAGQDFDKLLKTYKAIKTPFFKTVKFWFGASALVMASIAGLLLYNKMPDSINEPAFINPPIEEANVQPSTFVVNASADSTLTYKSGSQIHIPANAFLDAAGNVVAGLVELHYREFHDIADVFLAGIPMGYDSAGQQYHFETAGMMDISATQNGKPLYTNPKAAITVSMVSNNATDRFNTYYLDTVERKWNYKEQSNYNTPIEAKQAPISNSDTIIREPDKTPEITKTKQAIAVVKTEIVQLVKQKPVEPKEVKKGKPRFTINVDAEEFPEIATYTNVKFEVVDEKQYDPNKTNITWDDVKVERVADGINYDVTFSNAREKYTIRATPVFNTTDLAAAKKIYNQKYEEYTTKLAAKKAEQARLEAELAAKQKAIEEEIKKEIEAQKQRVREYVANLKQSELVYRTFVVAEFGIWNSDCPASLPQGARINALFTDKNTGKELHLQEVYLVEKGKQVMYHYYLNTLNNFSYNPNKENMIWGVTDKLEIAKITPEQFKEAIARKQGAATFAMQIADTKFKSAEEAKAWLGI